jgi:hypothetical protein
MGAGEALDFARSPPPQRAYVLAFAASNVLVTCLRITSEHIELVQRVPAAVRHGDRTLTRSVTRAMPPRQPTSTGSCGSPKPGLLKPLNSGWRAIAYRRGVAPTRHTPALVVSTIENNGNARLPVQSAAKDRGAGRAWTRDQRVEATFGEETGFLCAPARHERDR